MKFNLLRAAALGAVLGVGALLSACSSGTPSISRALATAPPTAVPTASPVASPTAAPTASPSPTPLAYTAVGASDAVGFGSTYPCATASSPNSLGVEPVEPPTCPLGIANPNAAGYVPDLANLLAASGPAVTLTDLGISGAVIGPDIATAGNMYGTIAGTDQCTSRTGNADAIPGDFITDELPSVPANSKIVTIFAGGNDTNAIVNAAACMSLGGATQTQITTYIDTEVTAFGTDLQTLVDGILTKTGAGAKIIVADLPNFAAIPVGQAQSAPVQALLQAVSVTGIDQGVYEVGYGEGLYTVDLLCDPNSYVTSNFYTDGFHPNSAGYALLAQKYLAQITAATPQTIPPTFSCSDAAITAVNRSDEAVHTLRYLEPR